MRLTKEDRSALANTGIGLGLNFAFLFLCALGLLLLGELAAAWVMVTGNVVFCVVVTICTAMIGFIHRFLRIDDDSNFAAYLYANAAVAAVLVVGWSAFVAIGISGWVADEPLWKSVVLYVVGLISVYGGYTLVSGYYGGSFYRMTNLPIALGSYVLFALWPAGGWAIFGWFFAIFGFQR